MSRNSKPLYKTSKDYLCFQLCSNNYKKCWRRKEKALCKKYRKEKERIKQERQQEKEAQAMEQFKSSYEDYIGEDTLDSKGDDIENKEFVENEAFWDCL